MPSSLSPSESFAASPASSAMHLVWLALPQPLPHLLPQPLPSLWQACWACWVLPPEPEHAFHSMLSPQPQPNGKAIIVPQSARQHTVDHITFSMPTALLQNIWQNCCNINRLAINHINYSQISDYIVRQYSTVIIIKCDVV